MKNLWEKSLPSGPDPGVGEARMRMGRKLWAQVPGNFGRATDLGDRTACAWSPCPAGDHEFDPARRHTSAVDPEALGADGTEREFRCREMISVAAEVNRAVFIRRVLSTGPIARRLAFGCHAPSTPARGQPTAHCPQR